MILVSLSAFNVYAQRDTVVIVVDTSANYVSYSEKIIPNGIYDYNKDESKYGKIEFLVDIICHYYDGTRDEDFAGMSLIKIYEGNGDLDISSSEIITKKNKLKEYKLVYGSTINKHHDLYEIGKMIGSINPRLFDGRQFLVFQSELDDRNQDSVTLHSVYVICGEVSY
jgi:hypothetical protein